MKLKLWAATGLVSVALVFSGCSSTGKRGQGEGASVEDGAGAQTSGANQGGAWTGSPLDNPNSPLYNKVVYFDFDKSDIRSEFVDTLRAHAGYLNTNRSANVTVEGHADERGSREYNIGLGERRAYAIKRFLEAEGVSGGQVNTISYGEERPAVEGSTESSWSQNRRGVLGY